MQVQKKEYKILVPDSGKYLCNMKDRVISDQVFLGINADPSDWTEIDETTKTILENEWELEAEIAAMQEIQ